MAARKPFLRTYTYTIPANGQKGPLKHGGRFFICKESSAAFKVTLDDVGPNDCEVGYGFKFSDANGNPAEFREIFLHNDTGSEVTVTIQVGSVEVLDSRLNTLVDRTVNVTVSSNTATYTKGTTGTVNGAVPAAFTGVDAGGKYRKSWSVFNKNAAGSGDQLVVYAQNGVECWRVDARTGFVIEGGGAVSIYGVDAAGVSKNVDYAVTEVFPT